MRNADMEYAMIVQNWVFEIDHVGGLMSLGIGQSFWKVRCLCLNKHWT